MYGSELAKFSRISSYFVRRGLRGEGFLRTEGLASRLPELGAAAAHDLVLADQFGAEFTAVQGEVDVKVYSVEDTLGRVHAFEVSLQILARQVRGEGDDLLDAWVGLVRDTVRGLGRGTHEDPWYTRGRRPHRKRIAHLRT